jgi:hypothetical protein
MTVTVTLTVTDNATVTVTMAENATVTVTVTPRSVPARLVWFIKINLKLSSAAIKPQNAVYALYAFYAFCAWWIIFGNRGPSLKVTSRPVSNFKQPQGLRL